MKKALGLLLAVVLVVSIFTGCGSPAAPAESSGSATKEAAKTEEASSEAKTEEGMKKVGFANFSYTQLFTKYVQDELVRYGKEKGIEIIATDCGMDADKMNQQVNDLLAQDIELLILVPCDYSSNVPAIKAANEKGVPVISMLNMADREEGIEYTYVGSSNEEAGIMQAEWLKDRLPENAKVVYMLGKLGEYHVPLRRDGFINTMEKLRPDVEVLAEQTANWTRDEGMKLMEDWLTKFPQIDAVVSANDEMVLGAIQAMKAQNRLEGTYTLGIDALPEAIDLIEKGEMSMSVLQDGVMQADTCIDVVLKILDGEKVEDTNVPFKIVDSDTVKDYLDYYKE